MFLTEECDDFISRLEAGNLPSYSENGARAVRTGDDVGGDREWVLALGNDEIPVLNLIRELSKSRLASQI